MDVGAGRILGDLDTLGKRVLKVFDVRDDNDFLKIVLDRLDDFDQFFAPFPVLRAEALVQDQGLQSGAGTVGQQARQGDADGKVDAERLAPAKQLVGPGAAAVIYFDVQSLDLVPGRFRRARGLEA